MTATDHPQGAPALELRHINAGYGEVPVLRDVSLTVPAGSIVALLGANGAGKSTTMRVAAGLLKPSAGDVLINDQAMTEHPANQRVRRGLCLIPEGRGIFRSLTVRENLALQVPPWSDQAIDPAIAAFPVLGQRLNQVAGTMSGGEQQMLALARCYLSKPSVVLLDELSTGLAPIIVREIFDTLASLAATGVAMLIVEQYVSQALALADTVHILNQGQIEHVGDPRALNQSALIESYLGSRP
jgi:branched-chain amino acid transport system ATP-binding protein